MTPKAPVTPARRVVTGADAWTACAQKRVVRNAAGGLLILRPWPAIPESSEGPAIRRRKARHGGRRRGAGRRARSPFECFAEASSTPTPGRPYTGDGPSGGGRCDRSSVEVVWRCPSGCGVWRTKQDCSKLDCCCCFPKLKKRRGDRALETLGGVPLGGWTFTLPPALRDLCGVEQARVIRKQLAALVREVYFELFGVDVGIIVAFHPTGDQCRGCGKRKNGRRKIDGEDVRIDGRRGRCPHCDEPDAWVPHFHVAVPLAGIRGGQVVSIPSFLSKEWEIAYMKRRYSEAVLAPASEAAGVPLQGVNVHYLYRREVQRRRHRLRYDLRPFPAWSAAGLGPLLTPQRYGLASAGAGWKGHDAEDDECPCALCGWRKRVARPRDDGDGLPCPKCGDALICVDITSRWTEKWFDWQNVAPYLDGEGDRQTGPPVEQHTSEHAGCTH